MQSSSENDIWRQVLRLSKTDVCDTSCKSEAAWSHVERAGLAVDALERALGTRAELGKERNGFVRACDIVKELAYDMGGQPWDVLPALSTYLKDKPKVEGLVNSAVAELMLDMLGKPNGSLWVPFDPWGVLTIRALRRGWSVNTAQLLPHYDSSLSRLLAIATTALMIARLSALPCAAPCTKVRSTLMVENRSLRI